MEELVDEYFKCPNCNERRVDMLENYGEGEDGYDHIKCLNCDYEYTL